MNVATVRFYQELNRFLQEGQSGALEYRFAGSPSVKDVIEAFGVPHTEVDLVLINNESVSFDARVGDGDRVAVYPMFESLDISRTSHVRGSPLRVTRFVLDVHLGKLARLLRLLGLDALYETYYTDPEIVEISLRDERVILTRDQGMLKRRAVTHGYWVRSTDPMEQVVEIVNRFDLRAQIRPFRRCMACNGVIDPVDKRQIEHTLEEGTKKHFDRFFQCRRCGRVYWRGSHYENLLGKLEYALGRPLDEQDPEDTARGGRSDG
jgi:hypothetical protein